MRDRVPIGVIVAPTVKCVSPTRGQLRTLPIITLPALLLPMSHQAPKPPHLNPPPKALHQRNLPQQANKTQQPTQTKNPCRISSDTDSCNAILCALNLAGKGSKWIVLQQLSDGHLVTPCRSQLRQELTQQMGKGLHFPTTWLRWIIPAPILAQQ